MPRRWPLDAGLCFWIVGCTIYGFAAFHFAHGHFLDQTSRDLWQHLAALRELIAHPFDPSNPFVPTHEGSRHFHPYWVSIALIARMLGWNAWQAIGFAGFISAGVLLIGIRSFGLAFYQTRWGPLALFAAMVLSWLLPSSHTGYHSMGTLIEGIAYPAALEIGLSLILWALIIRALENPVRAWLIVPLAAFMLATHQLGAGIGFMAASCFIALWPDATLKRRATVAAALGAGILLSAAWPYYSPFAAITRTGNVTWSGGIDFYGPLQLIIATVPSIAGLWGLRQPRFARRGLPVLAAFVLFSGVFALGLVGVMIATRFIMPAVLMLHIGMGALIIGLLENWDSFTKAKQLTLFATACTTITIYGMTTYSYLSLENKEYQEHGSAYDKMEALSRDIPDNQPIAAYDVAAWPLVATGQRVASIPWPEPEIADLAARQAAVKRMFDPTLSRVDRIALARRWNVRTLILDRRGPLRRAFPPALLSTLTAQSARRIDMGVFSRFDLY